MPRPVLVDLSLEPFLRAVSDDANIPTPRTGSKRSRSPSFARAIFSPAKRRILEQEALFPPSQSRFHPGASGHSLHPYRSALLHAFANPKCPSGSSPAGPSDAHPSPPCHSHTPSRRESRRISSRLSASPQSKSLPSPTTTPTRTSPRKTRSQTMTPATAQPQHARHTSTPSPPKSTATKKMTTGVAVTMVLRELPPPPDRRSVHYPGFDVHPDTHIALPCTRSKARVKADAAAARVQEEGDAAKENVRPVATSALSTNKVKGDVMPRRSARLRTNNSGCVPSQKVVAPDPRNHGRRWNTLHDSYLQL